LGLALYSAAAINLGFLLQQRGLHRDLAGAPGPRALVRAVLHSRSWLGGQAVGWLGFALQIAAVAIAPLSLVQAFAAGGLAISVPIAAVLFGYRVQRRQATTVALTAVALASLPLGLPVAHDHLAAGALAGCAAGAIAVGLGLARSRSAVMQAVAAGLLYGVADASIKAVSVDWGRHGAGALLSAWTLLAVGCTFAGFLSFQGSLRHGDAIAAISLMNALAALVALLCALVGFGESLGAGPLATVAHVAAIVLVLGCVPALAAAHTRMAGEGAAKQDGVGERGQPGAPPIGPARRAGEQSATGGEQDRLDPRTVPGGT